jgi:predicted small secreted protein
MVRLMLIVGLCIGALLVFSLYKFKIMQELMTKEVVTTFVDYKNIQSKLILPAKILYEKIIPVYT